MKETHLLIRDLEGKEEYSGLTLSRLDRIVTSAKLSVYEGLKKHEVFKVDTTATPEELRDDFETHVENLVYYQEQLEWLNELGEWIDESFKRRRKGEGQ